MLDNFIDDYHSYDMVYRHPDTLNCIFIGDMNSAQDFDFLQSQQIKTVVTAAKDMDHITLSPSIRHIIYPLLDGREQNIASFFSKFYEVIQNNIANGSILVHCAAGISRSSTLVISYIMKKQNKTFKEAIYYVRKARPNVLPNLGFQRQLKKYEQLLKGGKNSRNSRSRQVKTCEYGKRRISHASDVSSLRGLESESRLIIQPDTIKTNLSDPFSQKEIQILKIYNKEKQFSNSKKQFLFKRCRYGVNQKKQLLGKTPPTSPEAKNDISIKLFEKGQKKTKFKFKTALQEIRDIYLPKRSSHFAERLYSAQNESSFPKLNSEKHQL